MEVGESMKHKGCIVACARSSGDRRVGGALELVEIAFLAQVCKGKCREACLVLQWQLLMLLRGARRMGGRAIPGGLTEAYVCCRRPVRGAR